MCVDKPDELSVLTYIGYYCNRESVGKNALLDWINEKIPKYKISDFTSNWKDGMALGCLVDVVSGGQFADYEEMTSTTPLENAEKSMDYAESLGVPKVITPEQFVDSTLDPVTMMTYLTYFKNIKPSGDSLANISAAGPGITGGKAGKETNFVIRGRIPEWAPLDVIITAPDGTKLPFNKLDPVATSCAIRYKPLVPGNYTVEVLVNKEHIRGSPFSLHHSEPPDAAGCFATGDGLTKAIVGEKSDFSVDCSRGGAGQLQIEVHGPGGNIGTEVSESNGRVYSVKYTPIEAGPHTIAATWANNHIDKSPFTVRVIDPKKCTVSGPGLTGAVINQPATFYVKTKKAGQSTLSVAVTGPSGMVPVQTHENEPDSYICTYTPTENGNYAIDAKWEGIPITGSPFHVLPTVPANASKCTVRDLPVGYLRAGKEVNFIVDVTDAGDGLIKASGHGPSIPQKCSVRSLDSNSFETSFSPFEVGQLSIDVTFADQPISGSPFVFKVNDPTKCRINSAALQDGSYMVNQPVDFRVSAQFCGEGDVTAKLHGPKGEETVKVTDKGDGTYLIQFTPTEPGSHAFDVFFDGEQIPDAPVNLFVNAGSGSDDVVVTQPAVNRRGVFVVDTPHVFKVNASSANEGQLTANCVGVFTAHKPAVEIKDVGDKEYMVAINTAVPDEYKVNIIWSGDPVPGSPFTLNIVDKARPENVVIRGPSFDLSQPNISLNADVKDAGVGELSSSCRGHRVGSVPVKITEIGPKLYQLTIEPTQPDQFTISVLWDDEHVTGSPFKVDNIPPDASKVIVIKPDNFSTSVPAIFRVDATDAGVGTLKAHCRAENSANLPVQTDKPESDVEKYRCVVTPIREDVYHFSLLWSGKDVPGSPFKIDLIPKIHADRVILEDPIYSDIEHPVVINVDCTNAGPGKLIARCNGESSGSVPVSMIETDTIGKYKLEFEPPREDDYKVSVFFDKQEVARSPVAVSIRPIFEPVDVVLMENEHAGFDIFEDTVPLPDEDSTPLPPEPMHMFLGDPLHIDVESESEVDLTASAQGIVTGAAPIELVKKDNNNYSIDFKPNKPDRYIISLKYGDKEAPNSPIVVCYSVPVDASKCVILGLEKIPSYPMVNDPLTFAVLTENAGKADLRVTADGPSGSEPSRVEVVHDIDQPGTGIYNVTYTPTAPGEHRVHLQWGNDLIPGCPLVFNIVSGSAITGEIVYPYGSPIVLNVAADCKPKDLEAFAERDGERNKMKVAKDGKGQFKLSWQPTSPGFYDIHVLLKGKEVAGSPYHVQYSDPPNSRKVKVDITPEDIAYVHYPITFSIDTREAGKAELLLRANISKKLKEKSPDFVIKKNDDGTFTATYTPSQPVHHSFEVLFAGQPVEGSPFKLSVVEKPLDLTHILASNLNLLEVHKAVDVYFKLPNGDSISTVTASATGKSIDDADFKLQSLEENGFYRAHFVPSFPDDYQLELLHKNVPVSGSPFPVKVVGLGGFEPSSTPDDIDNPPIVEAKRPFSLLLPLDLNILPEELKVDIDGPPESSVTPDIRGTRGCFSVTLTPDIPGDYLIHVTKDDLAVPGSPYRIIVKEFRSDPSKCFVVPEDRPIFEKSQRFGKPCQFRISTIDAGPGTLNITSRGPGKADVKIYDNNDGTYTCEFSPSLPGQYSIDILWDDQHIGNSPYNLNFKQKKKKVITGLNLDSENFRVGVPHRFKLHCDEVGEGSLEVSIKPPTSAQIKVSDLGNESYQVEILPKEQGNHELAVQYGTGHILGSPFNVTFNEKGDASKCHMISNDVLQDDDGQDHVVFIISTKDAGKGKLTAHADNPGSNERLPVVIDEIEDEKFKIHFDIGDGAEYLLTVKYDTIHIEGSPFKLLFADQTDASVCQADGDGLSVSQVDREAKFNVLCEGGGDGQLTVEISSEDGTMVHPHVSNVAEEEFEVSYNPSKPGKHTITVKWGDNHVTGSPFDMKCYVPLHASNLSVIDPPSEAYLQTPIVFKVRAVEEMNEEGDLTVTAKSRSSTIVGSVKQEIDGSYTCSLEPTVSGKYVVKVTLNGDNIKESPFKIKVSDPPQPQNVKASGPGLDDGYVGQEGNFMLETGTAGTGTLSVRVHGPKGAFRINMRRHPEEERNILVRYDPKYSGKYSIDVTWSEVHIPGSPFKVEIFDQKDDKEGLEDGKAGDLSFLNGFEESGMSGDIQLSS